MVSSQEYVKRQLAKIQPLAGHSLAQLTAQPDSLATNERSPDAGAKLAARKGRPATLYITDPCAGRSWVDQDQPARDRRSD